MKAVSGRELGRILERHGWRLLRVRGSHHLYGKGASRIVVPVHGNQTLKAGLQRDLMKQAGLTEEDL
ncbi:MAG: type II toxin-antitoxin system HicA family toxin [Chloroflexota bacterium]|nr:type II toxin-antitoxin system HicA family toxin [Chloroflexota bacterium]